MLRWLRKLVSNDMSIDLGTANTLVYMKGLKKIVLNEPSVVAVKQGATHKEVLAVGLEAKKMMGRTPENITTIRPLRDGVIADFDVTQKMIQYFANKVHSAKFLKPSPRVLVSVPCGSTQVERRAIRESVIGAGAREVFLIEEPIAAALGAQLPIEEATGSMIVDMGGGTTEVAILSLGGVVYSTSLRVGGDKLDEAIVEYVRRHAGILIGEATAERVKQSIGSAYPQASVKYVEVHGRSLSEGIPKKATLSSHEVLEALQEPLSAILRAIKGALEKAPPELASDIAERGIVLTGGGALLKDIDKLIAEETGVPVWVAEDPLTCVARGGGRALEILDQLKGEFVTRE